LFDIFPQSDTFTGSAIEARRCFISTRAQGTLLINAHLRRQTTAPDQAPEPFKLALSYKPPNPYQIARHVVQILLVLIRFIFVGGIHVWLLASKVVASNREQNIPAYAPVYAIGEQSRRKDTRDSGRIIVYQVLSVLPIAALSSHGHNDLPVATQTHIGWHTKQNAVVGPIDDLCDLRAFTVIHEPSRHRNIARETEVSARHGDDLPT
jgi:hypothetical protein